MNLKFLKYQDSRHYLQIHYNFQIYQDIDPIYHLLHLYLNQLIDKQGVTRWTHDITAQDLR